jgi:hypothetical protein
MKDICDKNGGFHFKAAIKVKVKNQENSLLRVKEKMFKDIFGEQKL